VSCEGASHWTTEQLQAFSKDPTVPLWMLFKRAGQPSLVQSRRAPSLSGPFRTSKMTTCMSFQTLPTLQKPSPAIGEIPPVHPISPRFVSRFVCAWCMVHGAVCVCVCVCDRGGEQNQPKNHQNHQKPPFLMEIKGNGKGRGFDGFYQGKW